MRERPARYRAGRTVLACALPLGLQPTAAPAVIEIQLAARLPDQPGVTLTGDPVGAAWLARDGRRAVVVGGGADAAALASFVEGVVVPALLQRRGALVVHAAAIAVRGGALVIAGPSGAGKSTLAAALVGRGARLLADDAAVLEPGPPVRVVPVAGGLRLDAHGVARLGLEPAALAGYPASGKRLVPVRSAAGRGPDEAPLAALAWLADHGPCAPIALGPRDALTRLLCAELLPAPERVTPRDERGRLEAAAAVVAAAPTYALAPARGEGGIEATAAVLERLATWAA